MYLAAPVFAQVRFWKAVPGWKGEEKLIWKKKKLPGNYSKVNYAKIKKKKKKKKKLSSWSHLSTWNLELRGY
jgi:hypothetical protein